MLCATARRERDLAFRHLLEKHGLAAQKFAAVIATLGAKGLMLKAGSVVDATLIAAPSSTKSSTGTREPDMDQTKKRNNWYFGMMAHIAADAESGLVSPSGLQRGKGP